MGNCKESTETLCSLHPISRSSHIFLLKVQCQYQEIDMAYKVYSIVLCTFIMCIYLCDYYCSQDTEIPYQKSLPCAAPL